MKKSIRVPFFIRFDDLVKKIKETFGRDYEIVDIYQDKSGKWQIVIEDLEERKRKEMEERHKKFLESLEILGLYRMFTKGDLLLDGKPEIRGGVQGMVTVAKRRNCKN